jgi:hypothetical protein
MPIPALGSVQAEIHLVRCPDKLIRQSWPATGAEYYSCFAKGAVDLFVPPAGVPEFDDISAGRIELADNILEPRLGVAIARRELEQKQPIRSPRI